MRLRTPQNLLDFLLSTFIRPPILLLHSYRYYRLLVSDTISLSTTGTMGIASPITDRAWALANYSASYAYPPLVALSRAAVQSLFQQIRIGQLKIVDKDGTITICGQEKLRPDLPQERSVYSLPLTELTVHKDLFWVRLLLFADMV